MRKTVDVDQVILNDVLILKLGGIEYEIIDVPLHIFELAMTMKDDESTTDHFYNQLSYVLGISVEDVKSAGIGIRAAQIAMAEVRNFILDIATKDDEKNP